MSEITSEVLEFLRKRLENHAFSITYTEFPVSFTEAIAATSASEIMVPKPKALTREELEYCYAMEIHEAGHVLYGSIDFRRVEAFIRDMDFKIGLATALFNIIEDYRINVLIGVSHPGAGRILDAVHRRITKDRKFRIAFEAILPELCGYPYENVLDEKEKEKLRQACDIIYGVVTDTSLDATIKVIPAVYKIFEDDFPEDDEDDGDEGGDAEGEGEGEKGMEGDDSPSGEGESCRSGSSSSAVDGPPSASSSYEDRKELEDHPSLDKEQRLAEIKKAVKKLKESPKELADKKREKTEDLDSKEFRDIKKVFEEVKKIQEKSAKKEEEKLASLKKLSDEYKGKYKSSFCHSIEKETNEYQYRATERQYRKQIDRLVRDVKTVFLFAKGFQSGMRTGKLNGRKAHRLVTCGDSRIFLKKTDNKNAGEIAVCLLVDNSGSMFYKSRIDGARKASVVLHEVFRKLKVKHMIVSYTADVKSRGDTYHTVYKHWNDTLPAYNIPLMEPRRENRDGASIRMATKYFKEVTEPRRLLIIVSDGYPCASDYFDGLQDTIQAQREAKRMGIKLINIGIGKGYDLPKEYINKVKVDEVDTLPEALMRVLRKEMM